MKLSRFSDVKQAQVDQLVAYAQLLGLTGRDLVAIGGKLDRDQKRERKKTNKAIIESFECLHIGNDIKNLHNLNNRFKINTASGTYKFERGGFATYRITSMKTRVVIGHSPQYFNYDLPRTDYRTQQRYAMLLEIADGKFPLNF